MNVNKNRIIVNETLLMVVFVFKRYNGMLFGNKNSPGIVLKDARAICSGKNKLLEHLFQLAEAVDLKCRL